MTEDEFEKRLNHSYKVGISAGLSQAGSKLMEIAIEQFKRGTGSSSETRTWANMFSEMSNKAHPGVRK